MYAAPELVGLAIRNHERELERDLGDRRAARIADCVRTCCSTRPMDRLWRALRGSVDC